MDSGFEALPPRTGGRAKRKLAAEEDVGKDGVTSSSSSTSLFTSILRQPAKQQTNNSIPLHAGAASVSNVSVDHSAADATTPCLFDAVSTHGNAELEQWEYLDHTADVLVHTWGKSLVEAFGYAALSFWAHLVDPTLINISNTTGDGGGGGTTTVTTTTEVEEGKREKGKRRSATSASTGKTAASGMESSRSSSFTTGGAENAQEQEEEEDGLEGEAPQQQQEEDDGGGGGGGGEIEPRIISASGKDLLDLLFNFLDACLYAYGEDYFLAGRVRILEFTAPGIPSVDVYGTPSSSSSSSSGDAVTTNNETSSSSSTSTMMKIKAQCIGECFDPSRHRSHQGTEIKAITYSAMTIFGHDGRVWSAGGGGSSGTGTTTGAADGDLFAASHGELPSTTTTLTTNITTTPTSLLLGGATGDTLNQGDGDENQEEKRGARKGGVDMYFIVDI